MHSNNTSKLKSTAKINIISTIIVLALVGLSIFGYLWFNKSKIKIDNNPPTLSLEGTAFKGELLGSDVFITFTSEDVASWTDPTTSYITLKSGFNYVYATSEKNIYEIVDNFKPDVSNSMLIIAYSPSSSLFGQSGYNLYKKGPYPGTNEITNPSSFNIPAYYGFIIYTSKDTKAWELKDSSSALTWSGTTKEGETLINSLKNVNGWVLIPTSNSAQLSDFFGSLKTKILYFSKLKSKSSFNGEDFENGTTGPSNFSINNGASFMWVKLGNPEDQCNPGKYFAFGSCNNCSQYQYNSGWTQGINCISCPSGTPFNEVSGCHLDSCTSPQYANSMGECENCSPGYMYTGGGQCRKCANWEYASGKCQPCSYPTFAFSGGCTSCKSWQKPSSGSNACVDCGYWERYNGSNCTACSIQDYAVSKVCKTCPDSAPRAYTGQCHSCLPNQYPTGVSGYKSCFNCPPGKRYSGGFGCISCTSSQYYGEQQCTPCSVPTASFNPTGMVCY